MFLAEFCSGKKFSDHKVYNSRPLNRHQMSKNEVFPILYYSLVSNEHTILIWFFGEFIKFYFSLRHVLDDRKLSSRTVPDSVFNDFVDSNLREPDEFPKTVSFPSFLTSKTVALGSSCIVLKSVFKYLFVELKTCCSDNPRHENIKNPIPF